MTDLNEIIYGLEFTKAMITFNPSTGEDIEPENLNEDDKITYDACVGAISLLKEQEKLINELLELGYPHNFQHEAPWVVDYLYSLTEIIKKAFKAQEGR